jgi:ATP-dependent Lhr-like helicase
MLSEGIATGRGRAGALLHRDAVNRRLRSRRGARLAALTSGGAIPDTGLYEVLLEPEGTVIGTVEEDFAIESMAGDVFLLGNTSWRIRRVENGRVRVEDAAGQAPTIPFWLGEAPARTKELSSSVGDLRAEIARRLDEGETEALIAWLIEACALDRAGGRAGARLRRRRAGRAGGGAHPHPDRGRALLRRGGRHPARHPRPLRRTHQPGLGHGAAQALLPLVRLRAAGGGHR